jgi:hypothetical protein
MTAQSCTGHKDRGEKSPPLEYRMQQLTPTQLALLHRRAIEAEMAAALIDGYAAVIGQDQALKIAGSVIRNIARETGARLAVERGSNSLADLADLIAQLWCAEDALHIEILRQTKSKLHFNVIRCRYAEQYEQMGLKALGLCLSCNRDGALCEGFNPQIRLQRSQTIMQGAPFCDFRYDLHPVAT